MQKFNLSLKSRYKEVDRVHAVLDEIGTELGWSIELIFRLKLVLSEAINNVIRHGYGQQGDCPIEVSIACTPVKIEIKINDQARPFSIQDYITCEADPMSECGRGIFLIRQIMDEAKSLRRGQWNELILVKHLKEEKVMVNA